MEARAPMPYKYSEATVRENQIVEMRVFTNFAMEVFDDDSSGI